MLAVQVCIPSWRQLERACGISNSASVGEREQGNISLPCKKPSSNPITPWAPGKPLGFCPWTADWEGAGTASHPSVLGEASAYKTPIPREQLHPHRSPGMSLRSQPCGLGHQFPARTPSSCFASHAWYLHTGGVCFGAGLVYKLLALAVGSLPCVSRGAGSRRDRARGCRHCSR